MAGETPKQGNCHEDEDEWEYEYHPTEKEASTSRIFAEMLNLSLFQTFYVTLDLSSGVGAGVADNDDFNWYFHSKNQRRVWKDENVIQDQADDQRNGVSVTNQEGEDSDSTNSETSEARGKKADRRIQILELESSEPFIKVDGNTFRCSWHTGLGTDLFFSGPDKSPAGVAPLVKDPKFHLLAATNLKLIGHRVRMFDKEETFVQDVEPAETNVPVPGASANPSVNEQISGPFPTKKRANPYSIILGSGASESRKKQATFLEALMATKAARNETDEVYIGKGKQYQVEGEHRPRNGRRMAGLPKLHEEVNDLEEEGEGGSPLHQYFDQEQPSPEPTRQKRRYTRRSRIASAGGGLFRDFLVMRDEDEEHIKDGMYRFWQPSSHDATISTGARGAEGPATNADVEESQLPAPQVSSGAAGERSAAETADAQLAATHSQRED